MSLMESILLGILQGITEFLPVSSYGQILLAEQLFQMDTAGGLIFEILLHIGSAAAVGIVFRRDITRMNRASIQMLPAIIYNIKTYFYNLLHEQGEREYHLVMRNNYQKLAGLLLVSVLACAVTAYPLSRLAIVMSDSLLAIGLNFFITAVVLLVVDLWDYGTAIPNDMNFMQAVIIGICHGFSVFPGISSLGITIAVCLLCGLRKNFAVRYSFLLFIPISIGAFLFRFHEFASPQMTLQLGVIYVVGMIFAAVFSLLSARIMLKFLTKKRLRIFALYSLFVGILAIVYNFM